MSPIAKPTAGSGGAAELPDQVVVAPAARQGPQFALPVEGLEDEARVVGEPAHDAEVDLDKVAEAHGRKPLEKLAPVARAGPPAGAAPDRRPSAFSSASIDRIFRNARTFSLSAGSIGPKDSS